MSKMTYPRRGGREISAKYKALFRSLIPEMRSLLKMGSGSKWNAAVTAYNIATIVTWRVMARDMKTRDTIRKLQRAVKDLM